jgi:hypothetical protein
MSVQQDALTDAWTWLCEAVDSVGYGEASVKFVVHCGRVVRVERALMERKMPTMDVKEIPREALGHERKS